MSAPTPQNYLNTQKTFDAYYFPEAKSGIFSMLKLVHLVFDWILMWLHLVSEWLIGLHLRRRQLT